MSVDNFDDLIDGTPEKDVDISADGRVTVKGEEIPDGNRSVEEDVIDDSKTTPPQDEAPEGTESEQDEPSPFDEFMDKFREYGLEGQFKGGPEEMLRRVPEMNRYITQLEQERAQWRKQQTTQQESAEVPFPEDFYERPAEVIKKMIQNEMADVNKELQTMKYQAFVSSRPDFRELEPIMQEQLDANPGLQALGVDAVPVLYQMAKAQQLAKLAEQTKKVPEAGPDKELATSTTGKKTKSPPQNSKEYWQGKSLKEIERELGFSG